MTLKNHYKMGRRIYLKLRRQGIFLQRLWFLLGNLIPDLCISFVYRRHEYEATSMSLKKLMRRLYDGRLNPHSALFSFCLGIINHYVCDYFCYSHHPSFTGGLWAHIVYEMCQKPEYGIFSLRTAEPPPVTAGEIFSQTRIMTFSGMTDMLDECLASHERRRSQNTGRPFNDIPPAVSAAVRLNAILCFSAERFSYAGTLTDLVPVIFPRRHSFQWPALRIF
jgi:hypothetical protein